MVGLKFVSNLRELTDFYDEELSNNKLVPSTKKEAVYIWTALVLLIIGVILLFTTLATLKPILSIFPIILLVSALGMAQLAINSRNKSVKLHFGGGEKQQYLSLANRKSSEYENNILFAYRTDRIASKLNEMGIIKVEYITVIVEHLEKLSQNNKSKKWIPIGISGLFLIALWTEFVGKYLSSFSSVVYLILLGLILACVVFMLNIAIKIFLWSEAEKHQEIATMMKIILASKV